MTENAKSSLTLNADTVIQLQPEGAAQFVTSRIMGLYQDGLVVEYNDAMTVFGHLFRPGIQISVRLQHHDRYHQFSAGLRQVRQAPRRVLVLDQPGPMENIERRAQPRHVCDLPCHMEVRHQAEGRLININIKGCRLRYAWDSQYPPAFHKGDSVKLRIKIPARHTAYSVEGEIRGLTVRADAVEAGILFRDLPQALQTYLEAFPLS
jgi:hypothetical protein